MPRMIIVSCIFIMMGLIITMSNLLIGQAMSKLGLNINCDEYKTDLYGAYKAQRWIDSL